MTDFALDPTRAQDREERRAQFLERTRLRRLGERSLARLEILDWQAPLHAARAAAETRVADLAKARRRTKPKRKNSAAEAREVGRRISDGFAEGVRAGTAAAGAALREAGITAEEAAAATAKLTATIPHWTDIKPADTDSLAARINGRLRELAAA